ncbi:MAG TPA: hypothetical protein VHT28_08830, partial [Silvibacterium sp.]|nr:hypothetical protein [Silvibacterium sp.]
HQLVNSGGMMKRPDDQKGNFSNDVTWFARPGLSKIERSYIRSGHSKLGIGTVVLLNHLIPKYLVETWVLASYLHTNPANGYCAPGHQGEEDQTTPRAGLGQ